jgi:hypothetical protein
MTVPHKHKNFLKKLQAAERSDFNEAFAVRNCIVHRAAFVDQRLASITQEKVGASIALEKERLNRINRSLLKAGEAFANNAALSDVL